MQTGGAGTFTTNVVKAAKMGSECGLGDQQFANVRNGAEGYGYLYFESRAEIGMQIPIDRIVNGVSPEADWI